MKVTGISVRTLELKKMGAIITVFIAAVIAGMWGAWKWAENIAMEVLHTSDPSLSVVWFIWLAIVGLSGMIIRLFV
jgi:hypothetical protein